MVGLERIPVPRAVEMIRLPQGTLEEALTAIEALSLPDCPQEAQPFLEVRLLLPKPEARIRERILAAASCALLQRGPAEPSVSEVMGAAGLTVGGFYAHFESKDALMLEVFRQMLGQRRELIGQLDQSLPAEERRALMAALARLRSSPVEL